MLTETLGWVGTVVSIAGTTLLALNIPKSRWAYPIMLVGSAALLWMNLQMGVISQAALWAYYVLINVIGIYRWIARDQGMTREQWKAVARHHEENLEHLSDRFERLRGELHHYKEALELSALYENDAKVEERKRLYAEDALRRIAQKDPKTALTELEAAQEIARTALKTSPP